ncbi:MAG: hypothetical protein EGQ67_01825, partial [Clostridiales bacterium]|nr:hypothetical protein [Clostridiales bacterium]
ERGLAVREAGSDLVAKTERQEPLLYYGGSGSNGDKTAIEYISDMHLLHHVRYYGGDIRKTVGLRLNAQKEYARLLPTLDGTVAYAGSGFLRHTSGESAETKSSMESWRRDMPSVRSSMLTLLLPVCTAVNIIRALDHALRLHKSA